MRDTRHSASMSRTSVRDNPSLQTRRPTRGRDILRPRAACLALWRDWFVATAASGAQCGFTGPQRAYTHGPRGSTPRFQTAAQRSRLSAEPRQTRPPRPRDATRREVLHAGAGASFEEGDDAWEEEKMFFGGGASPSAWTATCPAAWAAWAVVASRRTRRLCMTSLV